MKKLEKYKKFFEQKDNEVVIDGQDTEVYAARSMMQERVKRALEIVFNFNGTILNVLLANNNDDSWKVRAVMFDGSIMDFLLSNYDTKMSFGQLGLNMENAEWKDADFK